MNNWREFANKIWQNMKYFNKTTRKIWDNFILINLKLHLDKRMFEAQNKLYENKINKNWVN